MHVVGMEQPHAAPDTWMWSDYDGPPQPWVPLLAVFGLVVFAANSTIQHASQLQDRVFQNSRLGQPWNMPTTKVFDNF